MAWNPQPISWSALIDAVMGFVFARSKGYREQAGRQDRDARGQVALALRTFRKRLEHEEDRRTAMRRGDTTKVVGDDLRLIDCAKHIWEIMEAVDNPLLGRRVAARVEQDLKALIGAPFVDHLKRRLRAPDRPRSISDMHAFLLEAVQADIIGKTAQTPIDGMFTGDDTDPEPVARVRKEVERITAYVVK